MATVRELVTFWGFEINAKPLDDLNERLKSMKETVKHLGEFLLGVVSGDAGGIAGLAISAAKAGIEATRMSQTLGVSTQKLQELQYAAKLSHIEVSSLTSGMRILALHTLSASRGSAESIQAFALAGIAMPSKLETTDQILMRISTRFQHMKDGIEKTGIATQLLGRQGAMLIPFLNKGPQGIAELTEKAERYGTILSDQTIKAGTKFYEVTEEGELAVQGLKNTLGASMLPILTNLVQKLLEWYATNRAIITQGLEKFLADLIPQAERLTSVLVHMLEMTWGLIQAFGGFDKVVRMVFGYLVGSEAFKAGQVFFDILKIIKEVNKALATTTLLEAMATGGASIAWGAAAAAAVGLGTYFLLAPGSVGKEPSFGSMPAPHFGAGQKTDYIHFAPRIENHFAASVKDPKEHAKVMNDEMGRYWSRVAANTLSGGVN